MVSIIIPAHNEEAVIRRCLEAITAQTGPGDEIIVVCNGCTDRTAERARDSNPSVRVEELPVPSKVAALNRGDERATQFPRLYVDADVVLGPGSVRALAEALEEGWEAVAPTVEHELSASSRGVRSYYRIWSQLPSVRDDTVGRGVYALSAAGRGRFSTFPDVLGDDHFVRDAIPPERRAVVPEARSVVHAPRDLRAVLRRRTRAVVGNQELDRATSLHRRRARRRRAEWLAVVRAQPELIPVVPLYVAVSVLPRLAATARRMRRRQPVWDRDATTR